MNELNRFSRVLRCGVTGALFAAVAAAQTQPQDRLREPWWAARHEAVLAQVRTTPNAALVMLGDSITQNYEKSRPPDENFLPTWERFYGTRSALNLGFSGDRTEHVLWRLDHGELDGLKPRAIVLLIGTNNTAAGQSAPETEAGIDAVLGKIREKAPQAGVLLLGILPSAISEKKTSADSEINGYLAGKYARDPKITYLDIGAVFYRGGELDTSIFYDPRLPRPGKALHPDTRGQLLMAEAIESDLTRLMQDSARQYLASLKDVNTALIPVPKLETDIYDWYERHDAVLAAKDRIKPRIVLIGDSITHFWGGAPQSNRVNGPKAWDAIFGHVPTLNLGFGWDRTQNVLWRLAHGEFDGLNPDTVVIKIGTNNLQNTVNARANTPEEIAEGVLRICDVVREKSPGSRIVVMGVFPRGFNPALPLRKSIPHLNRLLAIGLANRPNMEFMDIGARFFGSGLTVSKELMDDGTHPTEKGYQIWADALLEAGVGK